MVLLYLEIILDFGYTDLETVQTLKAQTDLLFCKYSKLATEGPP